MGEAVDWVLRVLTTIGASGVVLYWLKERRKNAAESEVAERTVPSSVAKIDLEAVAEQLATLREALRMERESKDNLIADLRAQLAEALTNVSTLRARAARQDQTIEELTERLARVEQKQEGT